MDLKLVTSAVVSVLVLVNTAAAASASIAQLTPNGAIDDRFPQERSAIEHLLTVAETLKIAPQDISLAMHEGRLAPRLSDIERLQTENNFAALEELSIPVDRRKKWWNQANDDTLKRVFPDVPEYEGAFQVGPGFRNLALLNYMSKRWSDRFGALPMTGRQNILDHILKGRPDPARGVELNGYAIEYVERRNSVYLPMIARLLGAPESALAQTVASEQEPPSSRFLAGCEEFHTPAQCGCLALVVAPVYPTVHDLVFDWRFIPDFIQQHPVQGLEVSRSCGIIEYGNLR
ncbi:MAG: hypothetical protein AAGM38_08180 [Pseudomonadota bacterium]